MVNWDDMHRKGERPWDLKGVTPMLKNFFENEEEGKELMKSQKIKRILIPGCGQVKQNGFDKLFYILEI